jgi:WD40 repeat protein
MADRRRPALISEAQTDPLADVVGLAWSPDGGIIAVTGRRDAPDNAAVLIDVTDLRRPSAIGRHLTGIAPGGDQELAFSADGTSLVTSGSPARAFDVHDPAGPSQIGQLPDDEYVLALTVTERGQTLAAVGGTERGASPSAGQFGLRIVDVTEPGAPRQVGPPLGGHTDQVQEAVFSANGELLVTSENGAAFIWDLSDPARPARLGRPLEPLTGHFDIALDPAGRTLVTSGPDESLLLWSLDEPHRPLQLAHPLQTRNDYYGSVAFSPDGSILAATGENGTILWDLQPVIDLRAHAIEQACRIAGGGLSPEEWARYLPDREYFDTCNI